MKPTILFILHLPPPIHGAAVVGQYIRESALINNSFKSDYIGLSTSEYLDEIGKSGFRKLFSLLKIQVKVFRALISTKYDLCYTSINSHGPGFYKDLFIVLVLKLFNKKIIYHLHNKGILSKQHLKLQDLLYRFTFNNTKSIILSKYLYLDIKKYAKERDVFYCFNGTPRPSSLITNLMINKSTRAKCSILFLSNMMEAKGVFILLEACKILKNKKLPFECHFVGSWFDISEERFKNYLIQSDLTDVVFAHGVKYNGDKLRFLHNSDIFVHPTLNDCFPLVLLEALSSGLPIVATNEGGIPDIIEEGKTGLLVPKGDVKTLADKLELLILNPELRKKMSVAAKERYDKLFTIEEFENNLHHILNSALLS